MLLPDDLALKYMCNKMGTIFIQTITPLKTPVRSEMWNSSLVIQVAPLLFWRQDLLEASAEVRGLLGGVCLARAVFQWSSGGVVLASSVPSAEPPWGFKDVPKISRLVASVHLCCLELNPIAT